MDMLNLVNQERRRNGLGPLVLDAQLNAAALAHSQDQYINNYFSHTGRDGSTFAQRIRRTGYHLGAGAENIAKGHTDASRTFGQWKHSAGHFANMMGPYKRMGIGRAGDVWTQVFG